MNYVYLALRKDTGHIKIGKTKDPEARVTSIARGTYRDMELVRVMEYPCSSDASTVEKYLHLMLADFASKDHNGHEWFTQNALAMVPELVAPGFAEEWLGRHHRPKTKRGKVMWSQKQNKFIFIPGAKYK